MDIYLIRHGETMENSKGTFYGSLEPHLNEKGLEQCQMIKEEIKNIKFSRIYVSEKKRALDTLKCLEVGEGIVANALNERSFGEFEGKAYSELQEQYKDEIEKWNKDWCNYVPPKGESFTLFYKRVEDFIKRLERETCSEDTVLIVTHGGVIRAFLTYVFGGDANMFWKFASRNGDLVKIKYENNYYYVDYIKPIEI